MRSLLLISVLSVLVACGSGSSDSDQAMDQINVSLDTVVVDPDEEFLFLKYDLAFSALSNDKSYLINFNIDDYTAERIDLDKLELKEKIQFEKEGPNGLGPYIAGFSLTKDDQLLFRNYQSYKIFDQSGLLTKDLQLEKLVVEYLGESEFYPMNVFEVEDDPGRMLVLTVKWQDYTYYLLDIDLENKSYQVVDLDILDKLKDFRVNILYDGNPAGGYGPSIYSQYHQGKILLSSNAFNELFIFELATDSIYSKSWSSALIGEKRTYTPPKEVEVTTGQMRDLTRKIQEDIAYKKFMWDEAGKVYYRFSEKVKFGEELNEYEEYIATGSTVYLSIFDQEFNLIREAEIPELERLAGIHFVKNGALWLYENIDDELGFVTVKIE